MYIVAAAWLYVAVLMAATEPSVVAGILTFVFYGAAPLALLLWLFGVPRRRRDRKTRGPPEQEAVSMARPPAPLVEGKEQSDR